MKDSNEAIAQINVLKQKLDSAKSAFTELQEDRNSKLQALLRFIGHLSLACKGQNLELDNKLAKLRHKLTAYEQLDEALPDLIEVERLLKGQYQHVMGQLEDGRAGLSRLIRQVQRVESAPEALKREVRYFKQELSKPLYTIWEYIPKVEQLIGFYEEILSRQLQEGERLAVLPKHLLQAEELIQLIAQIDFRKEQREQVLLIQEHLSGEVTVEALLDSYQTVIGLLIDNIVQEKSASQEFLFSLNDTLSAVQKVVGESYEHTQRSYQLKQQLNGEINARMNNLGESLTTLDDVAALKAYFTEQLDSLRTALSRKETLEQRDQALLGKCMQSMRNELNELGLETQSYKERLFEQQKLKLLDDLTQLPNRAALEERMEQEFRNQQRKQYPLWLAVADIDHFKSINDNFGHSSGDKALQVVAMAMKDALRDTEFVARYGGEEFVLIIPEVSAVDIKQLLNRVREKVKNIPFKFKNQNVTVTISIGAARLMPNESLRDTFDRADAALYKAKQESRDQVIIDG